MTKPNLPVVLIAEKLAPSVLSVFSGEVEVQHVDGTDRPALLEAVKGVDALLVRSATKVDAEVFLSDSHPAPNSGAKTTEQSGTGIYAVGPIRFDASGAPYAMLLRTES